jgi:sugar phosphate isomerase/epimerase
MQPPLPRISFSTLACPDWPWEAIARRAAEYGYNGVEVRLIERETDLLKRREFAEDTIAANLDLLESGGLAVCGLASSVRFDYLEREEREAQMAIGKLYIDLANRLGAEFIRVFGDVLPAEDEPAARHQVIRNIAAGLDALAEYSDLHSYGVDVLIETHGDFADSELLLELLVHVRHPRVGVLWDTHHPWRFFGEPVAETYARLQRWIRHTHWKDSQVVTEVTEKTAAEWAAAAEARSINRGHREASYVMFGTGEFPAAETMNLLVSGGYTGWCSLEWEKAWHPNLADPEVALPPFPAALKKLVL